VNLPSFRPAPFPRATVLLHPLELGAAKSRRFAKRVKDRKAQVVKGLRETLGEFVPGHLARSYRN